MSTGPVLTQPLPALEAQTTTYSSWVIPPHLALLSPDPTSQMATLVHTLLCTHTSAHLNAYTMLTHATVDQETSGQADRAMEGVI